MSELQNITSRLVSIEEQFRVHMEFHRQLSKSLIGLESQVAALIKWHTPEGFSVDGKLTVGLSPRRK